MLLAAGGERLRLLLRFDRASLEAGEWYRLLTGHLVHLGWSHVALNGIGMALCWLLVGQAFTFVEWLFVIAVCVVIMDSGFWLLMPDLAWYVGLSGLLHGVLAAGALAGAVRRSPEQAVVLAILLIKVAYESLAGPLPGTERATGGPVVTEAHLFGTVGGLLASAALIIGQRRRASI
ncbi:MAG: rhombosortase [Pseudomonadota bacterium]